MVFCHCPAGVGRRLYSNRQAINAYRDAGNEPSLAPVHRCVAGCDSPVSECGAMCLRCHEEAPALRRKQETKEAHWLYAVLFGLVAGCPLYFILFRLLGWMP